MPLGDVIAEFVLRPLFEVVVYGVTYWTGFVFLKVVTCGAVRLAPLGTIGDKARGKRKWHQIDWSIWLDRSKKGRVLKAEFTCLLGMLLWAGIGVGIYRSSRGDDGTAGQAVSQADGSHRLDAAGSEPASERSRERSDGVGDRGHRGDAGCLGIEDSRGLASVCEGG